MSNGSHPCRAPGCKTMVGYHHLMCGAHWRRVPKEIQNKVYREWSKVCTRRHLHTEYLEAVEAAVKAVAIKGTP